jgi:hypothetical protein
MTFDMQNKRGTAACHLRSACRRESDSRYFKALFEREWDFFVVKKDEKNGDLRPHIECCGKLSAYPQP